MNDLMKDVNYQSMLAQSIEDKMIFKDVIFNSEVSMSILLEALRSNPNIISVTWSQEDSSILIQLDESIVPYTPNTADYVSAVFASAIISTCGCAYPLGDINHPTHIYNLLISKKKNTNPTNQINTYKEGFDWVNNYIANPPLTYSFFKIFDLGQDQFIIYV